MKKFISVLLILALAFSLVACGGGTDTTKETPAETPVETPADDSGAETPADTSGEVKELNIGVLVWKYDDTYGSSVRTAMTKYAEELGAAAGVKINLDMQNGNDDQATQNDQAVVLLEKDLDLLIINLCDVSAGQVILDLAKSKNIPCVFYNKEPENPALVTDIGGIFIGTRAEEAGKMQGDLLTTLWNANPELDRNGDGKVQYIQFMGDPNNIEAIARSEFSVSQSIANGLELVDLNDGLIIANWDTAKAQEAMTPIWANHGDNIEAVFCNNDDMLLGVVAALNQVSVNTGNEGDLFIPIIGVDATDAALEALANGKIAGTVKQDGDAMGKAIIQTTLNGVEGKDWLDGTGYTLDTDGYSVRIPYTIISE